MLIRACFNRYSHGAVLRQIWRQNYVFFRDKGVAIKPRYLSFDTLKQVLKCLDDEYPKRGGKPLSYKELSNEQVLAHNAWIELVLADNGIYDDR